MEQADWRGMPFYDVFWRKRHLTQRELHLAYTNYYTYVFWALIISVLVLLDLHGFAERVSISALVTYTVSITLTTFVIYYYTSVVGIKLSKRHPRFFLVFPLVGFVAVTFSTYLVELGMSGFFNGKISLEYAAEKLPINFLLTIVLETFFLTFVLPTTIRPKHRVAQYHGAGREGGRHLTVAGKAYPCKTLISVSSQDHYVRIRTQDGEDMVRARLSDLVGQLDGQNGIQPHRSHWVSRQAVVGLRSRKGQKFLELCDGSEIPIARGRIGDVQSWLENTPGFA